jgi:hypothetical protein
MILSQAKLNELLKIFENPKSVEIYNKLREKEDMKNASKFINNYHIYVNLIILKKIIKIIYI